jgi:hypothetical protein
VVLACGVCGIMILSSLVCGSEEINRPGCCQTATRSLRLCSASGRFLD